MATGTNRWPVRRGWNSFGRTGWTGALAGLCSGIAMWVVAALLAQVLDQDVWLPSAALASMVLGAAVAAQTTAAMHTILVGIGLHMALATLGGVLFEILVRFVPAPFGPDAPEITGLLWGMAMFAASYFIVMPLAVPQLLAIYAPAWIIQFAVYGAALGLLYDLFRTRPAR